MKRLALLALTCLLAMCSCTGLVAKASATASYHTATYGHHCQGTGHPPAECGPCQAAINEAAWQLPVADINKRQGYLPPKEVADLKRLIAALESCP